ncbi:MAG: nuclease-related domain-containing protein [Methyloglobulus sp.]|nr:NERD domain-containing protein [Methyloglobulus sp.]
MAVEKLKSPLKDKPLRNPGESLDKQIFDLVFDGALIYLVISMLMVSMAMIEWHHWYFKAPPSPWISSLIALITVSYSAVKINRTLKKAKYLKQGRDGEKAVGQYLENLRENGAKVFHDIPGDNFNLDHVVICQSGLYVIETKTYSKPDKGEAKIIFNGDAIFLNGKIKVDKPIIQVRAASKWLNDLILELTGLKLTVKPVIVFPGWFIEPTSEAKNSEVWVLNPKALPTFIGNSKEQLSVEQVRMVSGHLGRYVRRFEDKKAK